MEDELEDIVEQDDEPHFEEFKPARFEIELGLPRGDESLLRDASSSVRQEFRECSKWKRLDCKRLSTCPITIS